MNIVCTAPNLANFLYNITHIEFLATYSILPNKRAVEVYCNHSPHIYYLRFIRTNARSRNPVCEATMDYWDTYGMQSLCVL